MCRLEEPRQANSLFADNVITRPNKSSTSNTQQETDAETGAALAPFVPFSMLDGLYQTFILEELENDVYFSLLD